MSGQRSAKLAPTIRALRARAEGVRQQELARASTRLAGLDPAQRAAVAAVTADAGPSETLGYGHGPAVRLATRQSALALAQTRLVADALRRAWPGLEVELVPVVTEGDRRRDVATTELGGKGVFTAAVQQAVLDGSADLA